MIPKNSKILILYIVLGFYNVNSNNLVRGLDNLDNASFNFKVGTYSYYIPAGRVFMGASEAISNNNFSVSLSERLMEKIFPLTPEKVALNNEQDKLNPLFGASIRCLSACKNKVIVVKNNDNSLYYVDPALGRGYIEVFSSEKINDADGQEVTNILAVTNNHENLVQEPELNTDVDAFVACSNKKSISLSLLKLKLFKEKQKDKDDKELEISRFKWHSYDVITGQDGNKALPIDIDTKEINLGKSGIKNISQAAELFFDPYLERLYIGLNLRTNSNSGALGILMAKKIDNTLVLEKIIPDIVFNNQDKIVGSTLPDNEINIKKIRMMHTTTHLSYIVVVRSFGQTDRVYALPIIDNKNLPDHGKLAKADSKPADILMSGSRRFHARGFTKVVQEPGDLYNLDSKEALVGGSLDLLENLSQKFGSINEVHVLKDTVFVSFKDSNHIYYSQALFDKFGRIKCWTDFKPAISYDYNFSYFAPDSEIGFFLSMPTTDGKTSDTLNRSSWSKGDSEFEEFISNEFTKKSGGVLSIFDFSQEYNLIGLTSNKKIMLFKSSFLKKNISRGFNPEVIKEEILDSLGLITSLEIVNSDNNIFLVAGGSDGVSIFPRDLLNQENYIKNIGNYKNVRKIVYDKNYLYILTNNRFDKVLLDKDSIKNNNFKIINLAKAKEKEFDKITSFSDFIVSGPLALLSTSAGLFRSGNKVDISNNNFNNIVNWKLIELPDSAGSFDGSGPVNRLFAISTTKREQDVAYNGNIYVLNGYVGYHQTHIYRLSCDLVNNIVDDNTVSLLPDIFYQDEPSFFTTIGEYRNYIYTDGAIIALTRSAHSKQKPILEIMPSKLKSGQRFTPNQALRINLNLEKYNSVSRLMRVGLTGSLVINGDFGIRIHQ